jgi:hypothetical protein
MHQDDRRRLRRPKGLQAALPFKAFHRAYLGFHLFDLIAFFRPRRGIAPLAETDAAVAVFSALVMRHFGAFFAPF